MAIDLTKADIDAALPRVASGLAKYLWLQVHRDTRDLRSNSLYRKRFNHFYRVRRGEDWQDQFYDLLERKNGETVTFGEVLDTLHRTTGRYEASFASKLLATLDPTMPVIDSIVLRNLSLRIPGRDSKNRLARIAELHRTLVTYFNDFLRTETGRYLVERFRKKYPEANITETKMVDLVLWQTRLNKTGRRTARNGRFRTPTRGRCVGR